MQKELGGEKKVGGEGGGRGGGGEAVEVAPNQEFYTHLSSTYVKFIHNSKEEYHNLW